MFKFLDDFIDKAIDKIKIWWNSGAQSVYDFVSKYENMQQSDYPTKKIVNKLKTVSESDFANRCSGIYENEKDCSVFSDENECSKQSGCSWIQKDKGFEIKPSPYNCYSSAYSCACSYILQPYMNHGLNSCRVLNKKGNFKIFYKKRFKTEDNYLKAIDNFYGEY
jgi:hypothetical protein